MTLGERIKELRLNQNPKMTQSKLAEKAGISRVAIGNYERGDRTPDAGTLQKIANALDVTVGDLFDDTNNSVSNEMHLDAVFKSLEKLDKIQGKIETQKEVDSTTRKPENINETKDKRIEYLEILVDAQYEMMEMQQNTIDDYREKFKVFRETLNAMQASIKSAKENPKEGDPDSTPTENEYGNKR